MPHDSCTVPECKEGHDFAYQGLKPQSSASSHQLVLHLIEKLIDFFLFLCVSRCCCLAHQLLSLSYWYIATAESGCWQQSCRW